MTLKRRDNKNLVSFICSLAAIYSEIPQNSNMHSFSKKSIDILVLIYKDWYSSFRINYQVSFSTSYDLKIENRLLKLEGSKPDLY